MFKKIIEKIAAAVLAILSPVIDAAKTEIAQKMDGQNQRLDGQKNVLDAVKDLINQILNKANSTEAKVTAIHESVSPLGRQVAELQKQVDALTAKQEQLDALTAKQEQLDALTAKLEQLDGKIPQEIIETRVKQLEERKQQLMEVPAHNNGETIDYAQIVNKIFYQLETGDVILNDDVPAELLQRIIILEGVKVDFSAGKLRIYKPKEEIFDFDPEAISTEHQRKENIKARLEREQRVNAQLSFIRIKIEEMIAEFKANPNNPVNVCISEQTTDDNPMLIPKWEGSADMQFVFYGEVCKLLQDHHMVMQFSSTKENGKMRFTKFGYSNYWCWAQESCEPKLYQSGGSCYSYSEGGAVYLHVLTKEERKVIEKDL